MLLTDFGWSYPPGCSGPPEDDYDPEIEGFTQDIDHQINMIPTEPGLPITTHLEGFERYHSSHTQLHDLIAANTGGEEWEKQIYDLCVRMSAQLYILAKHPGYIENARKEYEEEQEHERFMSLGRPKGW